MHKGHSTLWRRFTSPHAHSQAFAFLKLTRLGTTILTTIPMYVPKPEISQTPHHPPRCVSGIAFESRVTMNSGKENRGELKLLPTGPPTRNISPVHFPRRCTSWEQSVGPSRRFPAAQPDGTLVGQGGGDLKAKVWALSLIGRALSLSMRCMRWYSLHQECLAGSRGNNVVAWECRFVQGRYE